MAQYLFVSVAAAGHAVGSVLAEAYSVAAALSCKCYCV